MGIIKVLDVSFKGEGAQAPILTRVDKIESKGSLLLLDMSKVSDLPANNGKFTNLFADRARQITGEESSIDYNFSLNSSKGKIERTAKGGLHFIANPSITESYDSYAVIKETAAVRKFIKNNRMNLPTDHMFFFSAWVRYTTTGNAQRYTSNYSHDSNHNLQRIFYIGQSYSTGTGNKRMSAKSGYGYNPDGTVSLPIDSTNFNMFNGGAVGLNKVGSASRQYESVIFYRFYAEDLTLSGRTFEDVDALDNVLFNEAFAVGGKFYGDTYSDPNTVFA